MKKTLFFTHRNPQGYRIQQYFPFLENRGFEVELCTTEATFLQLLEKARSADVVYIQRILMNPVKLTLLRGAAKRIVFDFDDAVMYGPKGESNTRRRKFKNMVSRADTLFCGNSFLLEEAKKYKQDGSFYVPTVVDTDEYPVKTHAGGAPLTVGWMGSSSTLPYLAGLYPLFLSLGEKGECIFQVIADKPPDVKGQGIVFRKWSKAAEKSLLLGFDAGIMPLREDIWSVGKCGLKLIQYMASGLPSIADPVGVAQDMIQDGINGFLRSGKEEWRAAIVELAMNDDLRKKMGRAARETVEERYSLKIWGPKVAEIMDSL